MKTWKIGGVVTIIAACFLGGLYGGPIARGTYARLFPEPPFTTGNFSQLHAEAGSSVVLFSTSTCPYCKQTREMFAKAGVTYVDYMIDTSDVAKQKFQQLSGVGVPLIYIGDRRIRGFREPAIKDALAVLGAAKKAPDS
jgi:glutaredoxin